MFDSDIDGLPELDPTYHRMRREALERAEGTPRSDALDAIQACEYTVTHLFESALAHAEPAALGSLYEDLLDLLNRAYLLVSPELASNDFILPTPVG